MSFKKGKNYRSAKALVTKTKYTLREAADLIPQTSKTKFDATVEIHFRLGIDPKQADQLVRYTTSLPHGTGKSYKVIAFVPEDQVAGAKKAGAIEAGMDELIEKIVKGWMDFDIAVAHPSVMKGLGKVAKQLGQARKMPNPKGGTVSEDIPQAIQDIQKGQIEIRTDKDGIVHTIVGKVSFGSDKIYENTAALWKSLTDNKPSGAKGTYIRSISLATTMGPGLNIETTL